MSRSSNDEAKKKVSSPIFFSILFVKICIGKAFDILIFFNSMNESIKSIRMYKDVFFIVPLREG